MSEKLTMQEKDMQQVSAQQKVVKFAVKFMVYLFLIVMAVVVLFPFYWMIISSLKTLMEYRLSVPTFWPRKIMLSNYLEAFTTASLGRLFLNTMVGFICDALETNSQGRASAAALILFGIILVVTLINNQVSKKRIHY